MLNTKRALFADLAVPVGFAGSALAPGKKDQARGQNPAGNPDQTLKTQFDRSTMTWGPRHLFSIEKERGA
jgi:hypothetical protein